MSQKRNKIIVLITVIILAGLVIFMYINRNSFKNIKTSGNIIEITVSATPYDAALLGKFNNIALAGLRISLIDGLSGKEIQSGITDSKGRILFAQIRPGQDYYLKLDKSSVPAMFYNLSQEKITVPYYQDIIKIPLDLVLNEAALRDLHRQQAMYLYQSLLEQYKKDHGHYPVAMGTQKIINDKSPLILALKPYFKQLNIDASKLLDPQPDKKFFIYESGGVHYWLYGYPEVIFNILLFNQKTNSYLLTQ